MSMHWTPPTPPKPKPPPTHPEPGDWVTVIGLCGGCGRETGRTTVLWPVESPRVVTVSSCPAGVAGPICGACAPSMILQWTHWGPDINLRAYERPHP